MFIDTASEAARLGGGILLDNLHGRLASQASAKLNFDFVTEVDLLSEKAILDFIRRRHPSHRILAEESGESEAASEYLWIVDPLDGTTNYLRGLPVFSVSIALMKGDSLVAGAVFDPLRGELFHAERGGGAFLNGNPIKVSGNAEEGKVLLATGFPFRAKHLSAPYFTSMAALFARCGDFRRAGSAALDLANVACGRLDGFWEVTLGRWDIAAGVLLVEEAGGRVSDIWGGPTHLQCGHIAASNGRIHELITETVGPCFKDREAMRQRD